MKSLICGLTKFIKKQKIQDSEDEDITDDSSNEGLYFDSGEVWYILYIKHFYFVFMHQVTDLNIETTFIEWRGRGGRRGHAIHVLDNEMAKHTWACLEQN